MQSMRMLAFFVLFTLPVGAQELGSQDRVSGVVEELDLVTGTVSLRDEEKDRVVLRGTPPQLAAFRVGASVELPFAWYGDSRWLLTEGATSSETNLPTVRGQVTGLDKEEGTLTLSQEQGGATVHVHPRLLDELLPGQYVSVTLRQVRDQTWVAELERVQGSAED